jgi:RNA polymerase sigma factor (TIGR02999 family)
MGMGAACIPPLNTIYADLSIKYILLRIAALAGVVVECAVYSFAGFQRGNILRFNPLAPERSQGLATVLRELGGGLPLEFSCIAVLPMNDVTRILSAIEGGDPHAAEQLLPLVYDELRKLAAQKLAQEKPGQTLQATALVHEAYLRLVKVQKAERWESRGHFFAAAAEAMRRILLNRARDKKRLKRGGGRRRINLDQVEIALDTSDEQLIALDEALALLAVEDPSAAQLVNLRFFAGLSLKDAAATQGIALRTAERQWAYARAWLYARLCQADSQAAD